MSIIKKQINFEVKQLGDEKDRVLRFVGSDESADRDNDVIEVAGWKTSEYMKNPVFLWAHNGYSVPPIGKTLKVEKDMVSKRLIFDIKFPTLEELSSDIENPSEHAKFTDMIYNMYKNGYLNATSVGFRGVKFKTRDDPEVLDKPEWNRGRRYIEQNLLEISAVNIPANPNALQTAKSFGLISENEIKSFFMPEGRNIASTNSAEVSSNKTDLSEFLDNDKGGDDVDEKSGARLSKETIASLKAIKAEMESKMEEHTKVHKGCMEAYKGCMQKIDDFVGETSDGDTEESPKTVTIEDGMVKVLCDDGKTVRNFTIEDLKQLDASKINEYTEWLKNQSKSEKDIDINLDDIDFLSTKNNAAHNELNFKSEEIAQLIRTVIQEEIKIATGKI